jgi:Fe2+ transport system protein FeoA
LGNGRVAAQLPFADFGSVMIGSITPPARPQPTAARHLLPLTQLRPGAPARVRALAAQPEVACRLRELGLCEGRCVTLLGNGSQLICRVYSSRLALSRRLAECVLVEGESEQPGAPAGWWARVRFLGRALLRRCWGSPS